jgi:hypothetical protein
VPRLLGVVAHEQVDDDHVGGVAFPGLAQGSSESSVNNG